MSKTNTIIATLVRGRTYSLRSGDGFIKFENGEPKQVTADQRKVLETEAFDLFTVRDDPDRPETGRNERRAKFTFDISDAA